MCQNLFLEILFMSVAVVQVPKKPEPVPKRPEISAKKEEKKKITIQKGLGIKTIALKYFLLQNVSFKICFLRCIFTSKFIFNNT